MANNFKDEAVLNDVPLDENLKPVETPPPPKYGSIPSTAPQSSRSFSEMGSSLVRENTQDSFADEANTMAMSDSQFEKKLELGAGSFATGADMEDALADGQGFIETMAKGTSGFASRVALNTVGGLAAGAWGIGAMLTSGIGEDNEFDFTKIYQNDATDIYDTLDKVITDNLGIHKSTEFQNAGFLGKMTNLGMFMDEFGNAVAFTVGAIATEYLSGGLATAAVGARMSKLFRGATIAKGAKVADTAADAIRAQQLVGKAASNVKLKNALTFSRQTLVTGSAFEAGIETRHAMKELRTSLENKGFSAEEIENTVASAEKWMFAGNLLITNVSNAAQFGGLFKSPLSFIGQPKLFAGAQKFLKKQGGRLSNLSGGADTFISRDGIKLATRNMGGVKSALVGLSRAAANPFAEGMEEASQSILSGGVTSHYGSKGSGQGEAYISMLDGFMATAKKQFTTKEGWNETLMGAMVGAMGRPMMRKSDSTNPDSKKKLSWTDSVWTNYKTVANDKAKAETIVNEVNDHVQSYTGDKINAAIKSGIDMESYLVEMHKNGDKADLMYDNFVMNYMKPFAKYGYTDIARANMDVFKGMTGEQFAESILEANEAEAFIKGKSEKELTEFKDKQLDLIYNKMDNLEGAYELARTFDHFDSDLQDLFAEYHYKVQSIPQMNKALTDALFTRFEKGFNDKLAKSNSSNESDSIGAFENVKTLLSEMMLGNRVHTVEGKVVERTNADVADELETHIETLINDGIITPADAHEINKILRSEKTEVEGLTNGQSAAASIMHVLDKTSAQDTVREMLMLNVNKQELDQYSDIYNAMLADPKKYKKLKDKTLAPKIEATINELQDQLSGLSDEAYNKYVETIKANIKSLDPGIYKDLIETSEAKLEGIGIKKKQLAAEAEAAKAEAAKIASSEALENTNEDKDSTTPNESRSDEIFDPHTQYKVDSGAGITNRKNSKTGEMSDEGTRFMDFINDMKEAGVIPSFKTLKSEISFYTGDNPDASNPGTSNLDSQIPAMAEEEFEVFKMRFIDNYDHPDKLHVRVHVTADGTNLSFNTFMYTASGYANEQAMEDALKSLHNLIKVEKNNSKPSLKNIKVDFPYVNLTKGQFKFDTTENGDKIYKEVPLVKGIQTKHTNAKEQAASIMNNMVYSDSDGGVKDMLTKAVSNSYVSLAMDNNGKVIKGQTFLRGVDQFGRPTLFKLNARRLGDKGAEAELEVVKAVIQELMINPNPSTGAGETDATGQAVLDLADKILPQGIYKYDGLASLLSALVYHGDKTKGTASSMVMFTKEKAMIVKGKTYKYNAEASLERDVLIFDNLTDGGTVSYDYIMDAIGTIRQQISFSKMRGEDGVGKNDYAVHMMSHVITSDISMELKEATDDKGYDFESILEEPQMYIRRESYKAAEVEEHILADEGIESLFTSELIDKPLAEMVKVTNSEMESLSLQKALSNPNRYKVIVNNYQDDKVYVNGYPLPDGIQMHITGHNKGVVTYSFVPAKYGKFAKYTAEDWSELADEIKINITNGKDGKVHSSFISKIKGIPSMTITDTKLSGKNNKISIGNKQAESLVTTVNNNITKRVVLFITKEGRFKSKAGKMVDNTYNQAIKAIFFPGKDHDKIKNKTLAKFIKENPKQIQILDEILKSSAGFGFKKGRKGNNAIADIAIGIFNKYSIGETLKVEGNPYAKKDSLKEGEQSYYDKAVTQIADRAAEINAGLTEEQTKAFAKHIIVLAGAIGNAQSFISKSEKTQQESKSGEPLNIGATTTKAKNTKKVSKPGGKKKSALELARIAKGQDTTEEVKEPLEMTAEELLTGTEPDDNTSIPGGFNLGAIDNLISSRGNAADETWAPAPNAKKVNTNTEVTGKDEPAVVEKKEDSLAVFEAKLHPRIGHGDLSDAISAYFTAIEGSDASVLPLEIQFKPGVKAKGRLSILYIGENMIKGIDATKIFSADIINDTGRIEESNLTKNNCK